MSTASSSPILSSEEQLNEFFELGQQESRSPFLIASSRGWSINLTLKAAILAGILLLIAFISSYFFEFYSLTNLLLVIIYFLAGTPSLIEATEDLLDGEINIDILMTLAAFSSVFIGSGMEGALLLVLFSISGAMEDAVTAKAKGAISSLTKLSPTKACLIEADGNLIEKAIRDINVGAKILVKAGQVIPLDGKVIAGASSVNLVHLTGENLPITKIVGDNVPAGGRNLDGTLTVEVAHTSADSTLSKIIDLVTQAQEARPALQRWFDKVSKTYAMTIICLSAFFAVILPFVFSIPFFGLEGSVYRALAFLIAASPCALIIAIPIAYLSAISVCAKRGILLKGGITLDALAGCQAIAFDKTGTLTTGELNYVGIVTLDSQTATTDDLQNKALSIAYALEKNAVHPIANAIIKHFSTLNLPIVELKDFKAIPGYGLEAFIEHKGQSQKVLIGKASFIAGHYEDSLKRQLLEKVKEFEEKGELIAVLSIDGQPYVLRFRDTVRPKIKETIQAIQNQGWDTIMLTGDHLASAQRIAKELGIDTFYSALTPEDKLRHVTELAEQKGLTMIGDGVNDAPALARATVGICMGKVGSTTAIDAADVVLLHDNIELLDWLIAKAKQTTAIVKQNLTLATAAIIIASIPALGGWIPLWLAVVMHEGGTVLVGLNALRLLRKT